MIKTDKITFDDYCEIVEASIKQFGLRICRHCRKATIPIKRFNDGKFYYYENIISCDDHIYFDIIFANTTEQRKLYLNDRRN